MFMTQFPLTGLFIRSFNFFLSIDPLVGWTVYISLHLVN
jgi:hypothetical protein